MPAAPVTSTLTGSFSTFKKLHMYLISFQKKTTVNKTTKICWSNIRPSIFLVSFGFSFLFVFLEETNRFTTIHVRINSITFQFMFEIILSCYKEYTETSTFTTRHSDTKSKSIGNEGIQKIPSFSRKVLLFLCVLQRILRKRNERFENL